MRKEAFETFVRYGVSGSIIALAFGLAHAWNKLHWPANADEWFWAFALLGFIILEGFLIIGPLMYLFERSARRLQDRKR